MNTYTVIGIYLSDHQRFAESYEAKDAAQAEDMALAEHPGLVIAGVVLGDVDVVG